MRVRISQRVGHAESRVDVAVALASGFLGTLTMTMLMYVLPAMGIKQIDLPIWVARLFVTDAAYAAALGLAIHVLVGFVYALMYAVHVEPRLKVKPLHGGVMLGLGLWAFAQAVAVPVLGSLAGAAGSPESPGVLALNFGGSAAIASLLAHLAYGSSLALAYGCHFGGACAEPPPRTVSPRSTTPLH